ncbi:MAG: 6-phosphogluconate dehydrogenase, decarboxylating [Candidatus Levybacteria bacterium GW2011_GWB1_35_5]|nr:MAG: 6-phosphogluconate dehydrogenase, decarboxylating [Candidatus Levybacteria bacterium GW2011_GWB1_35_5]
MAFNMKIGFIGLGKMGNRMVGKLASAGHEVVVWNRTESVSKDLQREISSITVSSGIKDLIESLPTPRVIWIMISHKGVDEVLREVKQYLEKGDVVIDGGNSHFLDTEKRFNEFEKLGIHFLGVGTSGGILAEKNGYPFMVGGAIKGYEIIKPVLDSLSKPNGGYQYFGTGGAGHFVKMVHNGIEYGIMQSLGEGFEVLEKSKYNFNLLDIAKLWQKGTLVSGFMLDRAKDALEKNEKLDDIVGSIDASGEALWTIEEAKKEQVDVEIIERSLEYRIRSKKDKKIQNSFTARMVAALRREFGGHSVKEKTV